MDNAENKVKSLLGKRVLGLHDTGNPFYHGIARAVSDCGNFVFVDQNYYFLGIPLPCVRKWFRITNVRLVIEA